MTLPNYFTLVRHGYSEANLVQAKVKKNEPVDIPPEFFDRHDSTMRLTGKGVEQAQAAGEWLKANHTIGFDRFYVSPHSRTLETASHLRLNGDWRVDDRFRERDWGKLHSANADGTSPMTPEMKLAQEKSAWYWKPPSGESLSTGVRLRVTDIMTTLYRQNNVNSVIGVAHGELLRVAQFVIQKMTPIQWELMDRDPAYKMQNTMIIQYSTVDPNTGFNGKHYEWMRAVCPWDESLSWNGGDWVRFKSPTYKDDELVTLYENHATIFDTQALKTLG